MKKVINCAIILSLMVSLTSNGMFQKSTQDMQNDAIIRVDSIIQSLPEESGSLPIAAAQIRAIIASNKYVSDYFNKPDVTLKLVKQMARHFKSFDATAAQALGTEGAQKRLQLQYDFFHGVVGEYKQFSPQLFESFIQRGVDLEWVGLYGFTPLMFAVMSGKIAAVKALVAKGIDVDQRTTPNFGDLDNQIIYPEEETALSLLTTTRWEKFPTSQAIEMINILLAAGANPNATARLQYVKKACDSPIIVKAIEEARAKRRERQHIARLADFRSYEKVPSLGAQNIQSEVRATQE